MQKVSIFYHDENSYDEISYFTAIEMYPECKKDIDRCYYSGRDNSTTSLAVENAEFPKLVFMRR
jgi:hypothetical protein